MTSARRAASTAAAAAATPTGSDRAALRGSKKDRQCPGSMLTMTAPALDRLVGVLHGTEGVKMISTIFAGILVKGHRDLDPFA
jgi:hypothetical protein